MFKNRTHKIYPVTFPEPWASGWGEDEFGIWMSFTYKGIIQVFRWCEPGEFLMGSPEDEPERTDDETLHKVELTKGFWIADTTVTQALWLAVMGENPSSFKGDNNPVDSVSFEKVCIFIDKMNALKPELKLCLPSEAQWEYACRAETTSPFYFGNQIDSSVVNFDGGYLHGDVEKNEYREKTVAVKSLPPNGWGLYEMHGNVEEWCQDWFGEYPEPSTLDVVTSNPLGAEAGYYRVLRGGSWAHNDVYCRSAFRFSDDPAYDYDVMGFRLARGH